MESTMLDRALLWYGTYRTQVNVVLCVSTVGLFYVSFLREDIMVNPSMDRHSQHTAPLPRRNMFLVQSDLFQNLLKKNVSTFSDDEFTFFLSFKENQYMERRSSIKKFCSAQGDKFGLRVRDNSLVFDDADGIAYCQIAKVASSTWCNHFIRLANVTDKEYHKWQNALQLFAPSLWPPPSDVVSEWADMTSIVIVRHPMSRLASVYYQKFIELYQNKGWASVIRTMIKKYRRKGEKGPVDQPTPNEFIRYILNDLHNDQNNVDQHWRPQHLSCPFCLLDFSVYARMEELDQDSIYFFSKTNLTSRVNYKQKLNSAHAASSTERQFWSEVETSLVRQLEEPWAYKTDFTMFEYSVDTYMSQLGLAL